MRQLLDMYRLHGLVVIVDDVGRLFAVAIVHDIARSGVVRDQFPVNYVSGGAGSAKRRGIRRGSPYLRESPAAPWWPRKRRPWRLR